MRRKRKRTAPEHADAPVDPAHAPGKRHRGPPTPPVHEQRDVPAKRSHDQPWVPTSGLVGRRRRSARRG